MTNRRTWVLALTLALASCSSGTNEPSGRDAGGAGETATAFLHVHGLAVAGDGTLYVATHGGLIRRSGDAWVYASDDRNDHMGFSMDPRSGTMWRSGHSAAKPSLGVETSADGGRTWKHLSDVLDPPVDFHSMTVSHADPATLWGWDSGRRGTFVSSDGGANWTRLRENLFAYVLAAPAERSLLLAGVADGIVRSADGGRTWSPVAALAGGWVIALAADPSNAKHLLAFTHRGMKVSNDGGATWEPAIGGLPPKAEITSLAIDPTDPKVAYAAEATTLYSTADAGKTWTVIRSGS